MSSQQFFEKWFVTEGICERQLAEDQAARRHAAGQPYVVLRTLDDGERQVVDIAGEWVSIYFIDKGYRPYLQYDFKRLRPGELFLDTVRCDEYAAGDSREPDRVTTLRYQQDGSVSIERWHADETVEEKEGLINPMKNFEPYPEFGKYDHLCRFERD